MTALIIIAALAVGYITGMGHTVTIIGKAKG